VPLTGPAARAVFAGLRRVVSLAGHGAGQRPGPPWRWPGGHR